MIVCMNIGTDGERYIAFIKYSITQSKAELINELTHLKEFYDEVYHISFKPNTTFIDEIVLRGCRV